jgi:hypothetical protein
MFSIRISASRIMIRSSAAIDVQNMSGLVVDPDVKMKRRLLSERLAVSMAIICGM